MIILDSCDSIYKLYCELMYVVYFNLKYIDRDFFLLKIQYLHGNDYFIKCKKFIKKYESVYKEEKWFYNLYFIDCEYSLGNKDSFLLLLEKYLKDRPYNGCLVSSRGILAKYIDDEKVLRLFEKYYSREEIEKLLTTVKQENLLYEDFIKQNKLLEDYYKKLDKRL